MLTNIDARVDPLLFKPESLRRFLTKLVAEVNPKLSTQGITHDYLSMLFTHFIFPRIVFVYWEVRNNHKDYENWPEAVKMDHFIETCWKENFEHDLKQKFIYQV